MDIKKDLKKKENDIIGILYAVILCMVLSYFFDYYYELNDDYFIKNILSGVYSGIPSAHSIQMLYPLSLILSGLYRINRNIPWFGLFLNMCQFGCIFLITGRILDFLSQKWSKILALVLETGIIITFLLRELVFVQYTFTTAFLAATAAFLFYTSKPSTDIKGILKNNAICIALVIVAFNVRSEMLMLMLPMICVTGVCKWAIEKSIFTGKNAAKYFSVFGCILGGLLLCYAIDIVAYSGSEWKEFRTFFDNRTELYDFQSIPSYEGNETFYESIDMAPEEQILLVNYNFGIDESIDSVKMGKIAEYAKSLHKEQETDKVEIVKDIIKEYIYRTFRGIDVPWNLFAVAMYILVFLCAMANRHFRFIWEIAVMGLVRTGLWFFLMYRGRMPERITHSMYLMDILILMGMFLGEYKKDKISKIFMGIGCLIMLTFCTIYMSQSITGQYTRYLNADKHNKPFRELKEYVREHSDNYYFWDVASFAPYTEKMFVDVDNSLSNLDIMGGWLYKSPLTRQKLAAFGFDSMEDAIIKEENVYVIVATKEREDSPCFVDWITAYYAYREQSVTVEQIDSLYADGEEKFKIYQVNSTK